MNVTVIKSQHANFYNGDKTHCHCHVHTTWLWGLRYVSTSHWYLQSSQLEVLLPLQSLSDPLRGENVYKEVSSMPGSRGTARAGAEGTERQLECLLCIAGTENLKNWSNLHNYVYMCIHAIIIQFSLFLPVPHWGKVLPIYEERPWWW